MCFVTRICSHIQELDFVSKVYLCLCVKLYVKLCLKLCVKLCAMLCLKLCFKLCAKFCLNLCLKLCLMFLLQAGKSEVVDLFGDFCDGKSLLALLEALSGSPLVYNL